MTDQPFDEAQEKALLIGNAKTIGAVVSFTGLVREISPDAPDRFMLEHYPGMTEKMLERIARRAIERFALIDATIVHRVGEMSAGDEIVLVLAASRHRQAAFDGANFMMDYLKTRAPFWKKEGDGGWVEMREADEDAFARWGEDENL